MVTQPLVFSKKGKREEGGRTGASEQFLGNKRQVAATVRHYYYECLLAGPTTDLSSLAPP